MKSSGRAGVMSSSGGATRGGANRARIVALIVGGAFFMVLLDSAIIATSLPRMAESFSVSAVDLSVGISIYILAVAAFVPLSAWMSDRFGARRVFLSAIVIFTLASVLCGIASNLLEFVAARALQGLGGAFMTPVGRVLVLRNARKSELIQATAMITWPALIAPVIGPVVGGFITTYFSWHWNFFINLPLGVLALALAWRFIPDLPPLERRAFDLRGFLLTATALLCLLYGLESFAHAAIPVTYSALLVGVGTFLGVWSIRHLKTAASPLLDVSVFRLPTFAMATLSAGTYIRTGVNSTPFLLPLYFQVAFGYSPLESGGFVLVYFLGNLGMKTTTTWFLQTFGFRSVLIINGLLCGAAMMAIPLFDPALAKAAVMVVLVVAGLTRSMQYTALNTLAFADVTDRQKSAAATLTSMLQQVSMVLAIALAVLVLSGSRALAAREQLAVADFTAAFVAMGALVLVASLFFWKLPSDAGAEVSGRYRRPSP